MYLIRLDDASEYMDLKKWDRIENLLDRHKIKPIVGIIPDNQDESIISKYIRDLNFWNKAELWQKKDWTIALHGYSHVYSSDSGGINPINLRSEFAGVSLETQKMKIALGIEKFRNKGLIPKLFFAPSHTFDINTLEALKLESNIRIISDTIANDIYSMEGFYFVPQQSGQVRRLPFKISTFCYHPNNMHEQDFTRLENFILKNKHRFCKFDEIIFSDRKSSLYDKVLKVSYFLLRNIRNKLRGKLNERAY